ncbi:TspO/MBR family protein [Bauldia sp.]|uniref:TspO/MBR family protein n=1 Tax=Bauldia sp. TaxID=2575872 RepID=UPI003BAA4D1E
MTHQETTSSTSATPASRTPASQIIALVIFVVLCFAAAYVGQLATAPNIPTWYASLEKPPFNPPNEVFPIAWGILYTLMAIAAWLVWRTPDSRPRTWGLVAFAAQLVLNVAWSWGFFGAQSPLLGLVIIIPLILAILWATALYFRVTRLGGALMLPYLGWVCFATVLNIAILTLN